MGSAAGVRAVATPEQQRREQAPRAPALPPRRRASSERELLVFLALAFGLSWAIGGAGLLLGLGMAGLGLGALCPGVAALVLTRHYEGSVRPLVARITRWRIGLRWYAAALGLPVLLVGAAVVAGTAAGAELRDDAPPLWSAVLLLPIFLLFTGGPEEPGWRGFALPRLQQRLDALQASVAVGVLWALWHAPLWLLPVDVVQKEINYGLFSLVLVGLSIVLTWIYNSTGGSVLLPMTLHAAFNIAQLWLPSDTGTWVALVAVTSVAALLVVARSGRRNLSATGRVTRDGVIA